MTTRQRGIGVAALLSAFALYLMGAGDEHSGPAMNYRAISQSLATGGHFVGDGLEQLADKGLQVVIDLRPEDPSERRERVIRRDIEYVQVPVSWRNPKPADFDRFRLAMDEHRDQKVLVQCAANYRASAMTYLYRVLVAGTPEPEARHDLEQVWSPNNTWRQYIAAIIATHKKP